MCIRAAATRGMDGHGGRGEGSRGAAHQHRRDLDQYSLRTIAREGFKQSAKAAGRLLLERARRPEENEGREPHQMSIVSIPICTVKGGTGARRRRA